MRLFAAVKRVAPRLDAKRLRSSLLFAGYRQDAPFIEPHRSNAKSAHGRVQ